MEWVIETLSWAWANPDELAVRVFAAWGVINMVVSVYVKSTANTDDDRWWARVRDAVESVAIKGRRDK